MLYARWPWLSSVEASEPWKEFNTQIPVMAQLIFEAGTSSAVGDGATTFFWTGWWLRGGRIKDFVPSLFKKVTKQAIKSLWVREGLNGGWIEDIYLDLNAQAIVTLLSLASSL
jgi:hypothetical protein